MSSVTSASLELAGAQALEIAALQPGTLFVVDRTEADAFGEESVQLVETAEYEYELPQAFRLRGGVGHDACVTRSALRPWTGRLLPGNNAGLLPLVVEDSSGNPVGQLRVEVRTSKLGYRDEFRWMLEDIAERLLGAPDVLLTIFGDVEARLGTDAASHLSSMQQRWFFVRAVFDGEEFAPAVTRVLASPHARAEHRQEPMPVTRGIRPSRAAAAQLASGASRRIPVPRSHPLFARLPSIPEHIESVLRRETTDTPENRFVKHVLVELASWIAELDAALAALRFADDASAVRLRREVRSVSAVVGEWLEHSLIRALPRMQFPPLGSPVLQGRPGYREVLRFWLAFHLASQLEWDGGDDVFGGGSRDVPTLYEYWCWFVVYDAFHRIVLGKPTPWASLLSRSAQGIGLSLRKGRSIAEEAVISGGAVAATLSFNRSFGASPPNTPVLGTKIGSWTQAMRPDFTLTFRPSSMNELEAQAAGRLIHVHLDAKYRISKGTTTVDESVNDAERDDLLKMHAYRDAIRGSTGAVVLYPGDVLSLWRRGSSLLDSVGAVPLRPARPGDVLTLDQFIKDVADAASASVLGNKSPSPS